MVKKVGKWHVKGDIFKQKLRLSCVLVVPKIHPLYCFILTRLALAH